MLYKDYTQELIGFKDVTVTFAERKDNQLHLHMQMNRKTHKYPRCGRETNKIQTPAEVDQVESMLRISERLRQAYVLKNEFFKVMESQNSYEAKQRPARWNMLFYGYNLPEFND